MQAGGVALGRCPRQDPGPALDVRCINRDAVDVTELQRSLAGFGFASGSAAVFLA